MKLKHRSIRVTFFAAISIIALVFIGILVLLNVFFYQDYYMMTRRSELRDAYGSICTSYASDSSDVAALLDSYESRSAIRLAVVTDNGDVITSSAMQEGDVGFDFGHMEQKFRSFAVLASVVQNRDWVDLGKNEYRFMTISLRDNDQYLCLIGVLNAEHGEYLIAYMPYAYIEQNSSLNLVFLLIAGGCALLICLGCGYVISRQFTRPLIQMAGLADRMSELDFSMQYTGKGDGDEIDQLGQSLNRLSAYLEQSIGELKESNDQLAQEIEEKERIDNMRQEFIVNVSHELKTPLTSMKVLADSLVGQENVPIELYQEFMQDIAVEIDRENKIITDLLSLVKMDKKASDLNIAEININQLLEDILKRLRPIADKRHIDLILDSFRPVEADVDEVKFTLAVSNLVENGIKYNVDDGWVRVTLDADHKYFYVKVSDSGMGIPEESIGRIFERFYRVDKSHSKEIGGTGLGLSIVKHGAAYLGASLDLQSSPGEGSTFTLHWDLPEKE